MDRFVKQAVAFALSAFSLALAPGAVLGQDASRAAAAPSAEQSIEAAVLRALVAEREGSKRKLANGADLAIGFDGAPVAVADNRLVRLPDWSQISPEGLRVDRFAAGPGELYFVIAGKRLGLVHKKEFSPIVELPAQGMAVKSSETGTSLYVYGREPGGHSVIYRLDQGEGKPVYRKWIQTKERIGAVLSVGEDILFSVADTIYRAGIGADGRLFTVFVTTVPGMEITDLDRDDKNGILYIASATSIRSYRRGRILPFLHTGGRIRVSGDFLFILETERPQVLVVEHPERMVPR